MSNYRDLLTKTPSRTITYSNASYLCWKQADGKYIVLKQSNGFTSCDRVNAISTMPISLDQLDQAKYEELSF